MKHLFALCLLSFALLSGRAQSFLLLPSQLDTVALVDSIWGTSGRDGFRQNNKAVGQLNGRFPATLIDASGIVLVAKTAIKDYLPLEDTAEVVVFPVPLSLKNVVLSFPLEAEEITKQILPSADQELSEAARTAQIQRKLSQIRLQKDPTPAVRKMVKSHSGQSRFFQHRYLDYTQVQLLAYTNYSNGKDYALLRILGESPYPSTPEINLRDSLHRAAYLINYPPQTHYYSSASALDLHFRSLESNLQILDPTVAVYQSFRRLPPQKLVEFYAQQSSARRYLDEEKAIANRRQGENKYLMYPALLRLQQELAQTKADLEKRHHFYHLSQSLNQAIQVIPLSRFLDGQQGKSGTGERTLAFLESWANNWNPGIDQKLFQTLMPLYFDESQANYFSTALIDQIRSSGKSFARLGSQLYGESLLTQPQQLRSILKEEGTEALYQKLERDAGYIFFRQLLQDQEANVNRPYRQAFQEWTALEQAWLKAIAEVAPLPFLEGNATQRLHLLGAGGIAELPAWEDNAASPVFNAQHELLGFVFPANVPRAGVDWELPKEDGLYRFLSIDTVLERLNKSR